MKYAWLVAVLATPATADMVLSDDLNVAPAVSVNLCGAEDFDAMLAVLEGEWVSRGSGSVETQSQSILEDTESFALIGADASILTGTIVSVGHPVVLKDSGLVYDVDGVDDMLDTVEAPWIADAVSDTLCGPEQLMQLSAQVSDLPAINGMVTLLPYFTDRVVMITELEFRGDFGFASVTVAEVLTRQ